MIATERMLGVAARWQGSALDLIVTHALCGLQHTSEDNDSSFKQLWWTLVKTGPQNSQPLCVADVVDGREWQGWFECDVFGNTTSTIVSRAKTFRGLAEDRDE